MVYEMEAVMPLEVETPLLKVLVYFEFRIEVDWVKVRYEYLNLISEKRITAIYHHHG